MQLFLLRHTKVDVPEGMCYGQTDVGLADSSEEEVDKIFENLKEVSFDFVFTSPLSRCQRLYSALNSKKTLAKAQIDKRLMELNFGDWEQAFWKDFEQSKYAQKWFKDFVNISCPNGESYAQLIERTASFLKDLKEFPADSKVLIVTHGGVIRAFNVLINHIEAKNAFDLKVDYGEVFELSC